MKENMAKTKWKKNRIKYDIKDKKNNKLNKGVIKNRSKRSKIVYMASLKYK